MNEEDKERRARIVRAILEERRKSRVVPPRIQRRHVARMIRKSKYKRPRKEVASKNHLLEMVDEIKQLTEKGMPMKEIAKELGGTVHQVKWVKRKLALPNSPNYPVRKPLQEKLSEIRELVQLNLTNREIAQRVGATFNQIRGVKRRHL
jgi:DNA-binding NarL/FixJ family response regulator